MMTFMDKQLIRLKNTYAKFMAEMKEERGESNFVAILLVILIAVAIAVIFKNELTELVTSVFDKIDTDMGLSK